jgi:hypothetical protein
MKDIAEHFRMQDKRFCVVISIVFICFTITVCDSFQEVIPDPLSYDEAVKKVTFTGDTATVDFTNLYGHSIYLVKINTSGYAITAANTGGAVQALPAISLEENVGGSRSPEGSFFRYHLEKMEMSANPPPIDMEARRGAGTLADTVSYSVGGKKDFWVERNFNGGNWVNRQATLMASGEHGNIWVLDINTPSGTSNNKISTEQAEALSVCFDLIYPLATNLLGYEYGGGPGGNGGIDGDKKIQILIYDFYEPGYEPTGMSYAGFFSPTDFYTQDEIDRWGWRDKTNLAEIFYIDAKTVINTPNYTFSLLIHEFQHMINFNRKYIEHRVNGSTWYNEMLSMMAEDAIAPLIGVSNYNHPTQVRIPGFLNSYYEDGITEWNSRGNNYEKVYAFGAYLMRNYGGPGLLMGILNNQLIDVESLTLALKRYSGDMDFSKALARYGEAMIYSGSSMPEDVVNGIGVVSFDKTVSSTVNGQEYTVYGFDIWQMRRLGTYERGPLILNLEPVSMRPRSVVIQSIDGWKNKTGDFSITLEKPSNQYVLLFLMAR